MSHKPDEKQFSQNTALQLHYLSQNSQMVKQFIGAVIVTKRHTIYKLDPQLRTQLVGNTVTHFPTLIKTCLRLLATALT